MSGTVSGISDEGWQAFRRHAWQEAYEHLKAADDGRLKPEDLEALAASAWWIGRMGECIDARQRAYAAFSAAGRPADAARMALSLANDHSHRLERAMASGWMRRAERLLRDLPESNAHALLRRARVASALERGDLDAALQEADGVLDIGLRLADGDLQALGLHDRGRVLIARGDVEEGLALLDEAMVSAVSGELSPFPTAVIYCNVIIACQDLADYRRAGEYTEAAKRWCERQAIAGFPGMCRVRRAEVVRLRGAWAEAELEARKACVELQEFYLDYAGEGFYQVGEIRLRLGDVAGADDAFRQAHQMGRTPQPGLALLRLAEGDTTGAAALIEDALGEPSLTPLARARLLPAAVEIAIANEDTGRSARHVQELEGIAGGYGTPMLRAAALTARGACEVQSGEHVSALSTLRRALRLWQEVDAPYEAARTRLLLGTALTGRGDKEGARLELEAAKAAFDALGAVPDARRAAGQLGDAALDRIPAVRSEVRTFLFTDIVRSTPLVEAVGDDAWHALSRWHDETLRALFAAHGGQEVDHAGDGFFVVFGDPRPALDCAVAIQRTLEAHRRQHGFAPQVRIGIHTAKASGNAGRYRGRAVHTAARVAALAEGAEILASMGTLEAVGTRHRAAEEREVRLKGLSQPVVVASVDWR